MKNREVEMLAIMKALETVGVFDIQYGRATIDFDGQGKISNVKIEKNYRVIPISINLTEKTT
jgi:hypothetical protein